MPKPTPIRTVLVIPCFDEAKRLRTEDFTQALEQNPGLGLLFVDDGSRDATLERLKAFVQRHPERVSVHSLKRNQGKAEAVRQGILEIVRVGNTEHPWNPATLDFIGYWDADLSTPFSEYPRFLEIFAEKPQLWLVMGSRVKLLGRSIERHAYRHYLGRVFATAASYVLKLPVYDTQCGAKVFRYRPELVTIFQKEFLNAWIFDVELLARLIRECQAQKAGRAIYELPLLQWRDVEGSKVRAKDFPQAILSLLRIAQLYPASRAPRLEQP